MKRLPILRLLPFVFLTLAMSGCGVKPREFIGAAASGDVEALKRYLDSGVGPDFGGVTGKAGFPLHLAAYNGRIEAIQLLVEAGATVDASGYDNNTPLMSAVRNQEVEAVRLLIKHGANANARNNGFERPLHLAVSKGNLEIVRLLVKAGADVNAKRHASPNASRRAYEQPTPIVLARSGKHDDVVKFLEANGAK